jgi:DNA (cytosine-5)-methyltransferase 1
VTYTPYTLEDVRKASAQKKFSVISLFAGGGGSSTGYRLAGGDIRLINEFVEAAVETYTANFPDTPVLVDDIKK